METEKVKGAQKVKEEKLNS